MYLSQLILNPRSRRVQKEVADPYQMHRSIMRAFPDHLAPDAERMLYRLESHPRSGGLTLLVQSRNSPDWSWLAAPGAHGYLLPVDQANPAVKSFDLRLVAGQVVAFRLRANPTVKRKGKRLGLYREEEQRQWLMRKAEQSGFRVRSARVGGKGVASGRIHREDVTHSLRLLSVQFEGLLQVTDPDRLRQAVQQGIGSGKALGFGLLSLAPPLS